MPIFIEHRAKGISVLALAVLCFWSGTASAQLFLEEGKVVLSVSGGERLQKSIVLSNTSGESQIVRAYWEDFQYQPPYDGTKSFLPGGAGTASASQWITFSPQQFTIPPFGKQRIDYTVTVPDKIDSGHYGVLFFEKSTQEFQGQSGVNIVTRVGCLFFIEPQDKNKKSEIRDIQVQGGKLRGGFVNGGNVVLIPRITYYVMDEGGLVSDRGEIKRLYVPPGATANWEVPVPSGAGRQTVVVNADLGDGDVVVKEVDLAVDASGSAVVSNVRD